MSTKSSILVERMKGDSGAHDGLGSPVRKRPQLAYKNEDLLANKREEEAEENADDDELNMTELVVRTVLCPVVFPVILASMLFTSRHKRRLRAEMMAMRIAEFRAANPHLDDEDVHSFDLSPMEMYDDDGEEVELSVRLTQAWNRFVVWFKTSSVQLREYAFSLSRLKSETLETALAVRNSQKRKTSSKFVPAVDVARTDRILIPYDGVYIRNIFFDVKDKEKLTLMLEKERTESKEGDNQDNLGLESIMQKLSVAVPTPTMSTAAATTLSSSSIDGVVNTTGPSPVAVKLSSKPKKAPPTDSQVRINPNVGARVIVDGPSLDHLDQALAGALPGRTSPSSLLRSKIRQERRGWEPGAGGYSVDGTSEDGSPTLAKYTSKENATPEAMIKEFS